MRYWFGRSAFAFFIVAAALCWEGRIRSVEPWRGGNPRLYFAGAASCAILGTFGMRERHRRAPADDERDLLR